MTNGHSKVSYPPDWWDPDPLYVEVIEGSGGVLSDGTTNHPPIDFSKRPELTYVKPVVSRGVQRWVLLAVFALGLGIGLVLGWRWG